MGQCVVVRRYRDVSQLSQDQCPSPREDFLGHPRQRSLLPTVLSFCTALINLTVFCSVSTQILTEGLNLYIHCDGAKSLYPPHRIF